NDSSIAPRISSRSAAYSRSYDHTAMSVTALPDDEDRSTEGRRSPREERALDRNHRPEDPLDERRVRMHVAAAAAEELPAERHQREEERVPVRRLHDRE